MHATICWAANGYINVVRGEVLVYFCGVLLTDIFLAYGGGRDKLERVRKQKDADSRARDNAFSASGSLLDWLGPGDARSEYDLI